MKHGSIYVR